MKITKMGSIQFSGNMEDGEIFFKGFDFSAEGDLYSKDGKVRDDAGQLILRSVIDFLETLFYEGEGDFSPMQKQIEAAAERANYGNDLTID